MSGETLTKTEDSLEKMTSGLLDNILFIKQTQHKFSENVYFLILKSYGVY